jgi:hypothetical protein
MVDGIPIFVKKDGFGIFVSVHKFTFNLSLFQNAFHNLWKQAEVVLFSKSEVHLLLLLYA